MPRVGSSKMRTFGPHGEPFGQHDLLLVATRKSLRRDRDIGRLDPERAALHFGPRVRPALVEEAQAGVAAEIGQHDIIANRIL